MFSWVKKVAAPNESSGAPKEAPSNLPESRLTGLHVRDAVHAGDTTASGAYLGSSGLPTSADAIAYEPLQGLLAVSTRDGCIKLFGRMGVEKSVHTSSHHGRASATEQLLFVPNRGVLLRVSQAGAVDAWDLLEEAGTSGETIRALEPLELPAGDKVRAVAPLVAEPFLALGCSTGALCFAALTDASGSPVADGSPARGVKLTMHSVSAAELGAGADILELDALAIGNVHRLLARTAQGHISVWDIRSCSLVGSLRNTHAALARYGAVLAACWSNRSHTSFQFCTGHERGDILVWNVPGVGAAPAEPLTMASSTRVVLDDAGPVRRMMTAGPSDILVLGGGPVDAPMERLAVVTLPLDVSLGRADSAGTDDTAGSNGGSGNDIAALTIARPAQRLPWLGEVRSLALVHGTSGMHDCASGVLQLLDDGHVALQQLPGASSAAAAPIPAATLLPDSALLSPPLQTVLRAPGIGLTVAQLAVVPMTRQPGCLRCSASLSALRSAFESCMSGSLEVAAAASRRPHAEEDVARVQHHPDDAGGCSDPGTGTGAGDAHADASGSGSGAGDGGGDGGGVTGVGPCLPEALTTCFAAASSVLRGGAPPEPTLGAKAGLLLLTGHRDGFVRVWSVDGEQPALMASAPSTAAAMVTDASGAAAMDRVTCVQLEWERGILISGHANGQVRVYQFSERATEGCAVLLEQPGTAGAPVPVNEPPGFQLHFVASVHSRSAITCVCYDVQLHSLVVGDASGTMSLLDMGSQAVLWRATPHANEAITAVHLGLVPPSAGGAPAEAGPLAAAFFACSDGAVGALAFATGAPLLPASTGPLLPEGAPAAAGRKLPTPRDPHAGMPATASAAHLELLDGMGVPTWLPSSPFTQASLGACPEFDDGECDDPPKAAGSNRLTREDGDDGRSVAAYLLHVGIDAVHVFTTGSVSRGGSGRKGTAPLASARLASPPLGAHAFHVEGAAGLMVARHAHVPPSDRSAPPAGSSNNNNNNSSSSSGGGVGVSAGGGQRGAAAHSDGGAQGGLAFDVFALPSLARLASVDAASALPPHLAHLTCGTAVAGAGSGGSTHGGAGKGTPPGGAKEWVTPAMSQLGHTCLIGGSGEFALLGLARGTAPLAQGTELYDWELAAAAQAAASAVQQMQQARALGASADTDTAPPSSDGPHAPLGVALSRRRSVTSGGGGPVSCDTASSAELPLHEARTHSRELPPPAQPPSRKGSGGVDAAGVGGVGAALTAGTLTRLRRSVEGVRPVGAHSGHSTAPSARRSSDGGGSNAASTTPSESQHRSSRSRKVFAKLGGAFPTSLGGTLQEHLGGAFKDVAKGMQTLVHSVGDAALSSRAPHRPMDASSLASAYHTTHAPVGQVLMRAMMPPGAAHATAAQALRAQHATTRGSAHAANSMVGVPPSGELSPSSSPTATADSAHAAATAAAAPPPSSSLNSAAVGPPPSSLPPSQAVSTAAAPAGLKLQYSLATPAQGSTVGASPAGVPSAGGSGVSTSGGGGGGGTGGGSRHAVQEASPPAAQAPPALLVRTASEIKRQYRAQGYGGPDGASGSSSRAANMDKKVSEVHRAAYEARLKLEERGEKLRQLDEAASGLESEAAGFAEMAKRLKEQQSNPLKFW